MDLYINASELEDNNQDDELYENQESLKHQRNTHSGTQNYKQRDYDSDRIENNNQNYDLYENQGSLIRPEQQSREWNESNTNLRVHKFNQSGNDRGSTVNNALYENQESLDRREQQSRERIKLNTNYGVQKYTQEDLTGNSDLTITKTSRRSKLCCCFVGFLLGCIFATSVCVAVQYLLLPYLESSIRETIQDVKSPSVCSDDWMFYKENCYYLSTYNKSWEDAKEICKMSSSYLTDVNDREEADWLTKIMRQTKDANAWIGGKGKNSTDFEWYYDKDRIRPVNFTNWAPGQPSSPGQDCIQMWKYNDYKWDNELCYLHRRFVCKRSK